MTKDQEVDTSSDQASENREPQASASDTPRAVASRLWGGTPVIPPFTVEFAKSVQDIQDLIAKCRAGATDVGGQGDSKSVPMAVRNVPVFGEGQGNTFIGQGLVLEANVGATLNLTEYPGFENRLQFQYNAERESITCLSTAGVWAANKFLLLKHNRQFPCLPVSSDIQSNVLRIGGLLSTGAVGNWSVKEGPLAAHVLSLGVVTGTGEFRTVALDKTASDEDRQLGQAILGGYGGYAVIVTAEIATQPAGTPLPLPRNLAISASGFMKDADKLAAKTLDTAGYMTGLCLLFTFNEFDRPLYTWLQAETRIEESDVTSKPTKPAQPVTVPPIDAAKEPHKSELSRLWDDIKGVEHKLVAEVRHIEAEIKSDIKTGEKEFSNGVAKLLNDAIARIGIALGRHATEKLAEQGETWPPKAEYNVWLNLFFAGPTSCTEFLTKFCDEGIGTPEQIDLIRNQPEPLTYAPIWIIPMLRSAFENVPMLALPPPDDRDADGRWVSFIGIYPGENDAGKMGELSSYLTTVVWPCAQKLGATMYQVGSVPITGEELYGDRWPEVQQLKQTYDPDYILGNGYHLFPES